MAQVLRRLTPCQDERLLVGPTTRDDAAVFRLSADTALVATTDFFTPVVDDPFVFGRIAAANAISDVYAMGGRPLYALSIVGFPLGKLPAEMLGLIMEGAQAACREAGIDIVGGHSIDDAEPKFGLAVTGVVHPDRVLSNAGGRAGDQLLLTKPLGSGIATTAIKRGVDSPAIASAIEYMAALNRAAGEVFAEARVHALTDVTGFGLLGHLWNVCEGSQLGAVVESERLPLMPGVAELAQKGVVPGGTKRNLEDLAAHLRFPPDFPDWKRWILADAQTNGGLLAAVDPAQLNDVQQALAARGVAGTVVGRLVAGEVAITVE